MQRHSRRPHLRSHYLGRPAAVWQAALERRPAHRSATPESPTA